MKQQPLNPGQCVHARQRGGAYIAVLATCTLVVILGVTGLIANRLTAQTSELTNDALHARQLAVSAIDLALLHIQDNPSTWRADFAAGSVPNKVGLGRGTLTATATDPVDGDLLDDAADTVQLQGVGTFGDARALLQVTLDGDGRPIAGSWKHVTE